MRAGRWSRDRTKSGNSGVLAEGAASVALAGDAPGEDELAGYIASELGELGAALDVEADDLGEFVNEGCRIT